jgi:hypothetical protein
MHPFEAVGYLVPAGFRLVFQVAVLIVAVIAARRYKLTGLWILVGAVILAMLREALNMVFASMVHDGSDSSMAFSTWLQYAPAVTMIVVFCGWCVLAFSRKQGAKPDVVK